MEMLWSYGNFSWNPYADSKYEDLHFKLKGSSFKVTFHPSGFVRVVFFFLTKKGKEKFLLWRQRWEIFSPQDRPPLASQSPDLMGCPPATLRAWATGKHRPLKFSSNRTEEQLENSTALCWTLLLYCMHFIPDLVSIMFGQLLPLYLHGLLVLCASLPVLLSVHLMVLSIAVCSRPVPISQAPSMVDIV